MIFIYVERHKKVHPSVLPPAPTMHCLCNLLRCDYTSHLSLEFPPLAKLWVLLSLLCATWWCSLKSMNEDISGAVHAEQSHLRLTLLSNSPFHPPHSPPPPDTLLSLVLLLFLAVSVSCLIRVRHRSAPAHHIHCCCSFAPPALQAFFQLPLPIITCSR